MSCTRSGYHYWDGLSASQEATPERFKSHRGSALTWNLFLAGHAYGYCTPPVSLRNPVYRLNVIILAVGLCIKLI